MNRKKLTLSVDEAAIRRARRFSARHGTSISSLVSDFLGSLGAGSSVEGTTVARLRGVLNSSTDLSEYREHLEEKYGR